jgi:hypothetical protein
MVSRAAEGDGCSSLSQWCVWSDRMQGFCSCRIPNLCMPSVFTMCVWLGAAVCCALQVKDVKKAKFQLGVAEAKLGSAIQEATQVHAHSSSSSSSNSSSNGASRGTAAAATGAGFAAAACHWRQLGAKTAAVGPCSRVIAVAADIEWCVEGVQSFQLQQHCVGTPAGPAASCVALQCCMTGWLCQTQHASQPAVAGQQ